MYLSNSGILVKWKADIDMIRLLILNSNQFNQACLGNGIDKYEKGSDHGFDQCSGQGATHQTYTFSKEISGHFPFRNFAFEKMKILKSSRCRHLLKTFQNVTKMKCYLYSIEHGRLSLNGFIEVGIPTTRGSSLWYCSVYCFNS